jgi:hypothetical protein
MLYEIGQHVAHKSNPACTGVIVETVNAQHGEPAYIVKVDFNGRNEDWADHDTVALPTVGKGATIHMFTDRHAATIVKVTPTQVHVQQDVARPAAGHDYFGAQKYEYERNPGAPIRVFRKTKGGYRDANRDVLGIGYRCEYHDPHF